jgi:hypothetical protein
MTKTNTKRRKIMAVNLAKKYEDEVAERFAKGSLTSMAVNTDYKFNGVRSVTVYSVNTAPLGEYVRNGTARYGNPNDLGDTTQELVMTQDKAFTYIIDKGDDNEQMNVKGAAKSLRRELDEVIAPYLDKYRLDIWSHKAGTVKSLSEPTAANIVTQVLDATVELDNALVPENGRTLFIPANYYKFLKQSAEFMSSEKLGDEALSKGVVGQIDGMKVVKVPQSWMPTGVRFMITHDSAVMGVAKLQDYKIHSDPPGINGNLVEGRLLHDAFVLGAKAKGVFCGVASTLFTEVPTISKGASSYEIDCITSNSEIWVTLDGSDPRYSASARLLSGEILFSELTTGSEIKAYAKRLNGFQSDVKTLVHN